MSVFNWKVLGFYSYYNGLVLCFLIYIMNLGWDSFLDLYGEWNG